MTYFSGCSQEHDLLELSRLWREKVDMEPVPMGVGRRESTLRSVLRLALPHIVFLRKIVKEKKTPYFPFLGV